MLRIMTKAANNKQATPLMTQNLIRRNLSSLISFFFLFQPFRPHNKIGDQKHFAFNNEQRNFRRTIIVTIIHWPTITFNGTFGNNFNGPISPNRIVGVSSSNLWFLCLFQRKLDFLSRRSWKWKCQFHVCDRIYSPCRCCALRPIAATVKDENFNFFEFWSLFSFCFWGFSASDDTKLCDGWGSLTTHRWPWRLGSLELICWFPLLPSWCCFWSFFAHIAFPRRHIYHFNVHVATSITTSNSIKRYLTFHFIERSIRQCPLILFLHI